MKDVAEVKCEVNKRLHVTKHCVLTTILGNIWRELRAFANQSLERKTLPDATGEASSKEETEWDECTKWRLPGVNKEAAPDGENLRKLSSDHGTVFSFPRFSSL